MLQFNKQEETFTFFNNEGEEINRRTEIRFDPLSNETSRIVVDPGAPFTIPDYREIAEKTQGKHCPFCSENIFQLTPIFPKQIVPDGRLQLGEAIVVPNLFPYSKYNGVTVMTNEHYVRLEDFSIKVIADAFRASQQYIESVIKKEASDLSISINWNYLPYSGGSIIHPHLHLILSERETNYQRTFNRAAEHYQERYGHAYLSHLYEQEKQEGSRWIGELGKIGWLHAYAPKSHNDFLAIFRDIESIAQIKDEDWEDFARGLQAIFATLNEQGLASFNMVMHEAKKASPVHARFIPRLTMNQLGTSDINFFQSLHSEPLVYKVPEAVAKLARQHFSKLDP